MYVCMYVCMKYIYIYIYIYTCVCTHIHICNNDTSHANSNANLIIVAPGAYITTKDLNQETIPRIKHTQIATTLSN